MGRYTVHGRSYSGSAQSPQDREDYYNSMADAGFRLVGFDNYGFIVWENPPEKASLGKQNCQVCGGPPPTSPDDTSHDDCFV